MTRKFSQRSLSNLKDIHPDLVRVIEEALQSSPLDFIVIEGRRTLQRQKKLVASGASKTLNSRHLTGHAVDLLPIGPDGVAAFDWPLYDLLGPAVKKAAEDLGVPINWGGDWKSFRDGPHFELTREDYPLNAPWPPKGPVEPQSKEKDMPAIAAISGFKTYIIAAILVAIAIAEGPMGWDIPGVTVGDDWLAYVLNGLGLGTLRAGVAKAAIGLIRR